MSVILPIPTTLRGLCLSQNVALKARILIAPCLLHILFAVTNLISLLVCSPLVTVGSSLSHQVGHGGLSLPHADLDGVATYVRIENRVFQYIKFGGAWVVERGLWHEE